MTEIELTPLLPEIALLILGCLVLMVDLFTTDREKQSCYLVTQLGLIGIAIYLATHLPIKAFDYYLDTFRVDIFSQLLKIALIIISTLAVVYGRVFIRGRKFLRGEFYALVIFAVLGMCILVSGGHLLTLYLGLELLSLTMYAMIAMERGNSIGSEAAVKYFITGAIASGFILYGISLIYGITGQLGLTAIAEAIAVTEHPLLVSFAMIFIVAGVAFKLGLVPFHMWLPDVYQGSPTAITTFIASAPKIAVFGLTVRLLVETFSDLTEAWQPLILVAGVLSIAIGNLVAIAQTDLKRLLAYSGIAHMGYMILGIYAGGSVGHSAAMYYVITYALMTTAGFGLIIFLSRESYIYETLDEIKGLGRKNPWYGLMMSFVMLSMAGIPPFIGFWPKLEIFRSLVLNGYWQLAVFAVIFSVVGLFYYLRVIKLIYFDAPEHEFQFVRSRSIRFAITFNCLALLLFGLVPDTIYQFCLDAFT
ncbi:MAG: NADH-quinone oxidoreductase subunit NuoN [Gammaproteobacteria bacterium]|nr:NADH-quinone oxidoreductase subunit NuoN [Gammaproteobacteria bacterium]